MSALSLLCAAFLAATPQIKTSEQGFELYTAATGEAASAAEIHVKSDRAIVWLPGYSMTTHDYDVERGPVKHVRVYSAPKGVAITLSPRGAYELNGKVTVSAQGLVRVGENITEAAAVAVPAKNKHVRKGASASALFEEAVAKDKDNSAPAEAKTNADPTPDELGWVADARRDEKDALATSPVVRVWPVLLALSLLSIPAAWFVLRRRHKGQKDGGAIAILAARSLGGRHKLAVVEVDGERMLIATSDHEVTLLSHLQPSSGEGMAGQDFTLGLQPQQEAMPVPAPRAPVVPRTDASATPASSLSAMSSDVQGILNLRGPPGQQPRKLEVMK